MSAADPTLRIAAALLLVNGLGFGIPAVYGAWSLATGRGVATVMGFPSYGHGPFERAGVPNSAPLVLAFLLVCALECVAGAGLWMGARWGALLGLALLVPGGVFWWGFALPIAPVLRVASAGMTVAAWGKLS